MGRLIAHLRKVLTMMNNELNGLGAMTNTEKLYATVVAHLGIDVTPDDRIPDSVSCAYTFTRLVKLISPQIQWTDGVSTATVCDDMLKGKSFRQVRTPRAGTIIVSPTITIQNHGHIGIFIDDDVIASNDSNTGLLDTYWTYGSWKRYYKAKKGLDVLLFEMR